jgi:predicted enzyme related to lactoylglutathione lyase
MVSPAASSVGPAGTDVGGGKLIASVTDTDGNVIALVQAS